MSAWCAPGSQQRKVVPGLRITMLLIERRDGRTHGGDDVAISPGGVQYLSSLSVSSFWSWLIQHTAVNLVPVVRSEARI
ncbi:uncharacterized protein PG998_011680 [Apiospora kogelbergensis]|uniref:uncharacterized protein n=1 Tax=Apiospora kogelbergensis TaxID=1337665 RepID=UPI003131C1DF